MTTGQLIKNARKHAGLTQKELGEKLGVAYQTIAQWENNLRNPKYETIKRIAAALGVDWTELVPEDKQGPMVIDHMNEKLGGGKPFKKLSTEEAYRLGVLNLSFHSEEDRIAHFYSLLNLDGKLAASKYFYQNLDKGRVATVADYVERLSEIPQYQAATAPQSAPAPPEGKPQEEKSPGTKERGG